MTKVSAGSERLKLAVMIARMGPYHAARVAALTRAHGDVFALEVAAADATYQWSQVETSGFRRITLITDRNYEAAKAQRLSSLVVETLNRERPVAVGLNGWGFPEARAALGWCRRNGRTAVLMSDSQEIDAPRTAAKEWVKRWIVGQCDSAFVAGRTHAHYLQKLGMPPERIAFGYDVVDNEHFRCGADQARRSAGMRESLGLPSRYFLVVARFVEQKNLFELLRGFARYRAAAGAAAWSLVLLGDGPQRAPLERMRAELGLTASVFFQGFQQYSALPAYYGLASALVLPSISETWGLVVNEAMAAGLPVLVSKRCGASELVEDGVNGWTFDPFDQDRLASVMLELNRREAELGEMGRASLKTVSEYGPERFARGFLEAVEMGRARCQDRRPSRFAAWLLGA